MKRSWDEESLKAGGAQRKRVWFSVLGQREHVPGVQGGPGHAP